MGLSFLGGLGLGGAGGAIIGAMLKWGFDLLKPQARLWARTYSAERRLRQTRRLAPGYAPSGELWRQVGSRAGEIVAGPTGAEMVWVTPGELRMGNDDHDFLGDGPQHRVVLSRGFWVMRNLVTNAQYADYMNELFARDPRLARKDSAVNCERGEIRFDLSRARFLPYDGRDDYPVQGVNWFDARRYAAFYDLVLPTEAQWEYTARGCGGFLYPWGDQWVATNCCNSDNPGPSWDWQRKQFLPQGETADKYRVTQAVQVGSFPKAGSWCGALDMVGNLMQWCWDWHEPYVRSDPPPVDPKGPLAGSQKVVRGGNWFYGKTHCTTSNRSHKTDPQRSSNSVGFRCVFVPEQLLGSGE